jgi:hypothetical protein
MHILFSTYRTYTDTQTLIETLINRYQIVLPASLDMTEDVRQKTIKYDNIYLNIYIKYVFFLLLVLSVKYNSSMNIYKALSI